VITVRQATPDDADAIFAYWERAFEGDLTMPCAPGLHHMGRQELDAWFVMDDKAFAVVEDGGEIICTEIYDPSSAQSLWTHVLRGRANDALAPLFRWVCEQTGKKSWGWCGIVTSVNTYLANGWQEDEAGMLHWVGP
jgi:hypothetical protein